MSTPENSQEFWLRNELYSVLADMPVDTDCETLDQQLCRDLYLGARYVSFENMGADKIVFNMYGVLDVGDDLLPRYQHEVTDLVLRPQGWNKYGALTVMEGLTNEHGEPERLLLAGCVFTVDIQRHYKEKFGYISADAWMAATPQHLNETILNGDSVLAYAGGVALGSHLVFWRVYSVREMLDLVRATEQFNLADFTRISINGNDEDDVFIPSVLELAPGVLMSANFHTKDGEVITVEA